MTSDRIQCLRSYLDRNKGETDNIRRSLVECRHKLKEQKESLVLYEKAQIIIQQVARLTQSKLEYHISELVSLVLESVFDDPYKMELKFELKRGKSEAELFFSKNNQQTDPMSSSGGGVVDIASFALRVCLWSLQQPKSRNVIIMDEPFKHLSKDLREKAGEMLQEISKKLCIQIIMVTHDPALVEHADKVFKVEKKRIYSKVSLVTLE